MSHMVPDEVEPTEGPRRLLDDAPRLRIVGEIGGDCDRPPSGAGDWGPHRLGTRPVDVDDSNGRTLLRKAQGTRASHAGSGSCHDADLVLQAHCGFLPAFAPSSSPEKKSSTSARRSRELVSLANAP